MPQSSYAHNIQSWKLSLAYYSLVICGHKVEIRGKISSNLQNVTFITHWKSAMKNCCTIHIYLQSTILQLNTQPSLGGGQQERHLLSFQCMMHDLEEVPDSPCLFCFVACRSTTVQLLCLRLGFWKWSHDVPRSAMSLLDQFCRCGGMTVVTMQCRAAAHLVFIRRVFFSPWSGFAHSS